MSTFGTCEKAGTDNPKELTQRAMDLLLKPMQKLHILQHACSSENYPPERHELEDFIRDVYDDVHSARELVDLANLRCSRLNNSGEN